MLLRRPVFSRKLPHDHTPCQSARDKSYRRVTTVVGKPAAVSVRRAPCKAPAAADLSYDLVLETELYLAAGRRQAFELGLGLTQFNQAADPIKALIGFSKFARDTVVVVYSPTTFFWIPKPKKFKQVSRVRLLSCGTAEAMEDYLLELFGIDPSKGSVSAVYVQGQEEYYCTLREADELYALVLGTKLLRVYDTKQQ